jgi:hypothetical protein
MSYNEALDGIKISKAGDIGLHLDVGYLSNLAIPGFFKHAWIHVTDGNELGRATVIEAISEGVVRRHAMYPVYSDYAIILRPPQDKVNQHDTELAIKYANRLEGCKYDSKFEFDIEDAFIKLEELDDDRLRCKMLAITTDEHGVDVKQNEICEPLTVEKRMTIRNMMIQRLKLTEDEITNLDESKNNLKTTFGAFSCTEVVSFAWWHRRRELRIGRKRYAGKEIITADDLLNGFDIVWKSKNVTADVVRRKLPEVLTQKIADFK